MRVRSGSHSISDLRWTKTILCSLARQERFNARVPHSILSYYTYMGTAQHIILFYLYMMKLEQELELADK